MGVVLEKLQGKSFSNPEGSIFSHKKLMKKTLINLLQEKKVVAKKASKILQEKKVVAKKASKILIRTPRTATTKILIPKPIIAATEILIQKPKNSSLYDVGVEKRVLTHSSDTKTFVRIFNGSYC